MRWNIREPVTVFSLSMARLTSRTTRRSGQRSASDQAQDGASAFRYHLENFQNDRLFWKFSRKISPEGRNGRRHACPGTRRKNLFPTGSDFSCTCRHLRPNHGSGQAKQGRGPQFCTKVTDRRSFEIDLLSSEVFCCASSTATPAHPACYCPWRVRAKLKIILLVRRARAFRPNEISKNCALAWAHGIQRREPSCHGLLGRIIRRYSEVAERASKLAGLLASAR
jgi:hypothetical protein